MPIRVALDRVSSTSCPCSVGARRLKHSCADFSFEEVHLESLVQSNRFGDVLAPKLKPFAAKMT
jgi:hypothetical protein